MTDPALQATITKDYGLPANTPINIVIDHIMDLRTRSTQYFPEAELTREAARHEFLIAYRDRIRKGKS